jgi:hypothetical protein
MPLDAETGCAMPPAFCSVMQGLRRHFADAVASAELLTPPIRLPPSPILPSRGAAAAIARHAGFHQIAADYAPY